MLDEHGFEATGVAAIDPENIVTAVLAHPLHGRLIERVILWVQPHISYKGRRYDLSWWGNGVAYYKPSPV